MRWRMRMHSGYLNSSPSPFSYILPFVTRLHSDVTQPEKLRFSASAHWGFLTQPVGLFMFPELCLDTETPKSAGKARHKAEWRRGLKMGTGGGQRKKNRGLEKRWRGTAARRGKRRRGRVGGENRGNKKPGRGVGKGKKKKKRAQVVDGERWSSQKRGEIKERNCRRREVGKKWWFHTFKRVWRPTFQQHGDCPWTAVQKTASRRGAFAEHHL